MTRPAVSPTVSANLVALCVAIFGLAGCVSVDTPDTKVHVGITQLNLPGSDESDETPYAEQMKKVTAQQAKVAKQLAKQDWEELTDEAGDWVTYSRELTGYAATSHDPALFRACSEQVSRQAEAIRQAALRRDTAAAQAALAACDEPLNRLASFPRKRAAAQAAMASPRPAPPPPAAPSTASPRRPQVP